MRASKVSILGRHGRRLTGDYWRALVIDTNVTILQSAFPTFHVVSPPLNVIIIAEEIHFSPRFMNSPNGTLAIITLFIYPFLFPIHLLLVVQVLYKRKNMKIFQLKSILYLSIRLTHLLSFKQSKKTVGQTSADQFSISNSIKPFNWSVIKAVSIKF